MRILTVLLTVCVLSVSAQDQHPDWTTLMNDPNTNFYELQEQFNAYWEGREHEKGDGYKPFKRWEHWAEKRVDENGKLRTAGEHRRLFEDVQEYRNSRSLEGNWQELGPILDGATTREDIPGVGRINAVEFHPTDPLTIYAGAPSGGLWRTTNGGEWWTRLTDDLPTLGVSAVVLDPTNPDIIYIGTGDRDSNDAPGLGVYKSEDGGETWTQGFGMPDVVVGMMAINPEDTDIVFAASDDGVYRTLNGGESWSLVSNTSNYKDVKIHPTNPDIVYATGSAAVYRSTNGGASFSNVGGTVSFSSRSVIGVCPAQPDLVYICGANTSDFRAFFRSTDAGETWEEMSNSPNILGWSNDASGGQAWFDLTMAVNPQNPLEIYVGGVRVLRSIDGGVTWSEATNNFVHVDQHCSAFSPHTNNFWLGNDGGIYEYVDNEVWKDVSNGMVISQMYKLGQSPFTHNNVLTGFQDNGTSEWTGTKWERRVGADGMECMYDFQDEAYQYGAIQNGEIRRTGPGFVAQPIARNGFGGIDENGIWVTPYTLDVENSNIMYLGYLNLWRCNDVKTENVEDIEWEQLSDNLINNDGANVNEICQSIANPSNMYISKITRKLFRNDDINDPDSPWINLSNNLPQFNLTIDDLEAHPFDENVMYMALFREVYKTSDKGETWEQMTDENFPDLVINSIEYDKNSDEGLYIGTEMGVFYKDATMSEWIPFSGGNLPPAVNVTELEIYYGEDLASSRIRAATYGRGLWESDLYDSETYYFPAKAKVIAESLEGEIFGATDLSVRFYKNLNFVNADGLEISDIAVTNATIVSLEGGPVDYTLTIEPTSFGEVTVSVSAEAATDDFGVLTEESEVLSLAYNSIPEPLGIYGPGGVGDTDNLSYWFMADEQMLTEENGTVPAEGGLVGYWGDVSGNNAIATQNISAQRPFYVPNSDLFNGMPAIQLTADSAFLRTSDIVVKENVAAFAVASAELFPNGFTFWNEYGWIASGRGPNGFLIHPWKDAFHTTGIIYDNANNETIGLNTVFVPGINTATIHGMQFYNNSVNKYLDSYVNGNVDKIQANNVVRDAEDEVQVNFGRDFGDRYGAGLIAEQILYTERLYDTHTILVRNYLSSKYSAPCDALDRYFQDELYNLDVAGIGQMSEFDKHLDAQGRGIVRMSEPADMDNGEFLLWGTNNASMEWGWGSDVFLTGRVSRTWGYEETGDVGEVLVRIYDEGGNLDEGLDGQIGIIYLENEIFDFGMTPEFTLLTEVEDGVWSANVNFSGRGVFTIGVQPIVNVEEQPKAEFLMYPNPASNIVTVNLNDDTFLQFELIDQQGRIVKKVNVMDSTIDFDVAGLSSGVYTVRGIRKDGSSVTQLLDVMKN
ncbi:MAG: T9SS type A sorting domain-containing protein [Flavobacteriales bacterium]